MFVNFQILNVSHSKILLFEILTLNHLIRRIKYKLLTWESIQNYIAYSSSEDTICIPICMIQFLNKFSNEVIWDNLFF